MHHRSPGNSSTCRKHNAVLFSTVQAWKQVPKSSDNYASASSALSYMHSVVLSSFMPSSSTADGPSMPSSIFNHKPHDKSKINAFSTQLKKHFWDCEDARGRGVIMAVRSDLR